MGSTAGTKVNEEVLDANTGKELKNGCEISFGASSRAYKVTVDYSKYQRAIKERQRNLQVEINEIEELDDSNLNDMRRKLGSS